MEIIPKIAVSELHKSFDSKIVLDGSSLSVNTGESLVVIGGSGTGKSVLIKCILGILNADKGSIKIDGIETTNLTEQKRENINKNFGMLFQSAALFDSMTVWENVSFGVRAENNISRRQARDLAAEKLASVGMGKDVLDLYPAELSGGMQKRVGLARAIANNPNIIFFDEPTTGLDPIMADVINNLIIHVTQEVGATALTITHDMVSAKKISTHIAMLYQGKIIWHGPTEDIDKTENPFVQQFIHGKADGPIKTLEKINPQ